MYQIEKNIPIIQKVGKRNEIRKIMESMEILDSFFMETIQEQSLANNSKQCIKGKKFTIRKFEKGFRCWRIS